MTFCSLFIVVLTANINTDIFVEPKNVDPAPEEWEKWLYIPQYVFSVFLFLQAIEASKLNASSEFQMSQHTLWCSKKYNMRSCWTCNILKNNLFQK